MAMLRRVVELSRVPTPVVRRLRVLAFDPSLTSRLDTAGINEILVELPWEDLEPGPVGEYVEVIDYDPASGVFYHPVDLDEKHLLAQNGLAPSESNPQFHQQMVYAVAMTTIRHFERALGRVALWAEHKKNNGAVVQFVRRLRIYPHALRDRNAYYSPAKKAVLFGYFPVMTKDAYNTPGTLVFTSLSHDIIAHEVTHALLDGVHPRFNEPTNADVHAFHEAFADIVALFQHFTYPSVLESQIAKTRGELDNESLLGKLAQQFGHATGRGAALRDALGNPDQTTGVWTPQKPDPHKLEKTFGAHARGAVLVAAVFRAFVQMYRARTSDLFRIATQGTGKLPEGEIHPDLTRRLASEAAHCADRVLQMCIRAIDYCPPVNITFGDFLRGIITADVEYAPNDKASNRIVFAESFREWGIYPRGLTSIGLESLEWPSGDALMIDLIADGKLRNTPEQLLNTDMGFLKTAAQEWNLESNRFDVWRHMRGVRIALHDWLRNGDAVGMDYARIFNLVIDPAKAPNTVTRSASGISFEVHSARPSLRRTLSGALRTDLVVEITQTRDGYFDPNEQEKYDKGAKKPKGKHADFKYRAGSTIIIDPATQVVRRVIATPGTIADNNELTRVRRYLCGEFGNEGNAFDAGLAVSRQMQNSQARQEPFALLHTLEESR
jgi:hypothetical protein